MIKYLTAEGVCIGHPDKLCDLISDSILDEALSLDKDAHTAVETLATDGKIIVCGEIACKEKINVRVTVRKALVKAGYDPDDFSISVFLHTQSKDIASGVKCALETRGTDSKDAEQGAGDQGTVYGYATLECGAMLPLPLVLSNNICKSLDEAREKGFIKGIYSDGKAQVTVQYDDDIPERISTIVVSVQHDENKNLETLKDEIIEHVLKPALKYFPLDEKTKVYINPSGRFVEGGPSADTGLTGRKLMVDTYGGLAPHGGGAFSGKDPSKVDRSACYAARFAAKNIVLAGLAKKCTVSFSYAIGKAEPVGVNVCTDGSGIYSDEELANALVKVFPTKPKDIIERLSLKSVRYQETATYGHFSSPLYPWEESDEALQGLLIKELEDGRKK